MPVQCLEVPTEQGEEVRLKLLELGALAPYRIESDRGLLFLPISDVEQVSELLDRYRTVPRDPDPLPVKERYDHISYDVIGEIAVVRPSEDLDAEEAASSILSRHGKVRTVALDHGVKGEHRIRDLEVIAGPDDLTTVHRENGLRLSIDLGRCFYSPRLATERERIAGLVQDEETVVDMFCGVGPFALLIARRPAVSVTAIDSNLSCIEHLQRNISLNKVENIDLAEGDARQIGEALAGNGVVADRILMNHPHHAHEFLDVAMRLAGDEAVIHLYSMVGPEDGPHIIDMIERTARDSSHKVSEIGEHVVRSYSPGIDNICFDVILKR